MNLINKETEIQEDQFEEYALQLNAQDFACRAKAKAKTQNEQNLLALHQESFLIEAQNEQNLLALHQESLLELD